MVERISSEHVWKLQRSLDMAWVGDFGNVLPPRDCAHPPRPYERKNIAGRDRVGRIAHFRAVFCDAALLAFGSDPTGFG